MKKIILVFAMIVAIGFTFTSCKNDKKEDAKAEEVKAGEETASNEVYQCPMDCEHGKSYTEAGSCPVCKMDLKAKKAGESVDEHKHLADCKCKEGEKCTCPKGECKCSDKADAEICTKCGKSKAECKSHDDDAKKCEKCGDKECTCPKEDKA